MSRASPALSTSKGYFRPRVYLKRAFYSEIRYTQKRYTRTSNRKVRRRLIFPDPEEIDEEKNDLNMF